MAATSNGLAAFIRADTRSEAGPILYLSGAETAGDLEGQLTAAGFDCHRVVLYDAVPADSLGAAGRALRSGGIDAVLLYSPRRPRIWRGAGGGGGTGAAGGREIRHFCLSRNVAAALPEGWERAVSASPDEPAMLEPCLNKRGEPFRSIGHERPERRRAAPGRR